MNASEQLVGCQPQVPLRIGLVSLICFHAVACCISLVYASQYHPLFHIFFDPARLHVAIALIVAFALVSYFFTVVDFSFGYFVGFYFYTMVLGSCGELAN
jgi:hypothetical protein